MPSWTWLSSHHLRELPALWCSSSQALAICPSVNAIKNLCPEERDPNPSFFFFFFLIFFIRLHHLEGNSNITQLHLWSAPWSTPAADIAMSQGRENISTFLLPPCRRWSSSAEPHAPAKVFLAVCECCQGAVFITTGWNLSRDLTLALLTLPCPQ